MDAYFVISLVVGVVSVVLALVAIWFSVHSERKSAENYNRTRDVLSKISQKAGVIEATVNNTQEKLVDTITEIAKPKQETQEELIMKTVVPAIMQNPDMLERLIRASEQQDT
jgi:hypothetical protein